MGSPAQAQPLRRAGLDAPQHVGSSQTGDQARCPLHWQADSCPLRHQGSPLVRCERGFCSPAGPTLCSIGPESPFPSLGKGAPGLEFLLREPAAGQEEQSRMSTDYPVGVGNTSVL